MVIAEGWTLCMPVLVALGFIVDTLYYGGKHLKYQQFYPEVSYWTLFSVVIISNLYTRRLNVGLVNVQLIL